MSWSDLTESVFKQTAELFGETCVYWPKSSPSFEIRAIFDSAYQVLTGAQGAMAVQSLQPKVSVKLSEFPSPPDEGDRVELRGSVYDVIEFQPDSHGGAILILQKSDYAPS